MIFDIGLLIILFYILGHSSRWVVDALVGLGIRLRISKFIIGFVILGLATSASEFFVAMNALINKVPTLSLGNILGASLVLLSLIAGLAVIFNKQINIFKAITFKELLFLNGVIFLPGVLVLNGVLSRLDGLILIAVYGLYIGYIITKKAFTTLPDGLHEKGQKTSELIGFLIFGLLVLTIAAKYAVDIGADLAFDFGIPPLAVGLLIFSIGTNLPELFIAFETRRSGKYLLFGNLLGSSAANSMIIGLVAFFQPIRVTNLAAINLTVLFLAGTLLALNVTALTQKKITRPEGALLIGIYIVFITASIILNLL